MTPQRSPSIFQNVVAMSLGLSWSDARAFVEAQGCKTFARSKSTRTWAMVARDWDSLAAKLGIAAPAQLAVSLQAAADLADAITGGRMSHVRSRHRRRD